MQKEPIFISTSFSDVLYGLVWMQKLKRCVDAEERVVWAVEQVTAALIVFASKDCELCLWRSGFAILLKSRFET